MSGRQVDGCELVVGAPGYGKTSLVGTRVRHYLSQGYWAFLHDPNAQFGCPTYASTDAWRERMARHKKDKQPMPRAAAFTCQADDVTELVCDLGRRMKNSKERYAEDVTFPMVDAKDETSLMQSSGATNISKLDNEELCNRRHYGVVPILNLQRGSALMTGFFDLATDVYLFHVPREDARAELERKLNLEKGALAYLADAPKHRFAHWRKGEGLIQC